MRNRHFNREGMPISFEQWGPLFEDQKYRQVEKTEFKDGSFVSTIWMGLDHGGGGPGDPPVIFETMTFSAPEGEKRGDEEDCQRTSAEEDARECHRQKVAEHLLRHPELVAAAIEWWGRCVHRYER